MNDVWFECTDIFEFTNSFMESLTCEMTAFVVVKPVEKTGTKNLRGCVENVDKLPENWFFSGVEGVAGKVKVLKFVGQEKVEDVWDASFFDIQDLRH